MNPKLQHLLEEDRARRRAETDRALVELGLCVEKKVYLSAQLSEAEAIELGFDQSEIVDGARRRYRLERTPIELTDQERAIALKIYESRAREALARAGDEPDSGASFAIQRRAAGRSARESRTGWAFASLGIASWIAGLILACTSAFHDVPVLPSLILFGLIGVPAISSGAMHNLLGGIAERTREQTIEIHETPTD